MCSKKLDKIITQLKIALNKIIGIIKNFFIRLSSSVSFVKQVTLKFLTKVLEEFKLTYKKYVKIIKDTYSTLKKRLLAILDYIENVFHQLNLRRVKFQDWYEGIISKVLDKLPEPVKKVLRWLIKFLLSFR